MNLRDLAALGWLTIRDTGAAWPRLRALRLSVAELWMALAGLVAIAALLGWVATQIFPPPPPTPEQPDFLAALIRLLSQSPLTVAAMQFAGLAGAAALLALAGRAFGGQASFADALLAVVWLESIMLVAQLAQLAIVLLLPFIAGFTQLAELALYVFLAVRLTQVPHGFRNPLLVALGMVATLMAVSLLLAMLMVTLGLVPPPEVAAR